jgi:hypothetical protein
VNLYRDSSLASVTAENAGAKKLIPRDEVARYRFDTNLLGPIKKETGQLSMMV